MTNPLSRYLSAVLLLNGIGNLLAAGLMMGFPPLGLGIPGWTQPDATAGFALAGWGVAALTFGVARVWASRQPVHAWYMATLGLLEGAVLVTTCVLWVLLGPPTWVQAALPLSFGGVFGTAYALAFVWRRRSPLA